MNKMNFAILYNYVQLVTICLLLFPLIGSYKIKK